MTTGIKSGMKVIGADGAHVGTVDRVVGERIKLSRKDSTDGSHHFLSIGLVAEIEGHDVRLSTTGANAHELFEED